MTAAKALLAILVVVELALGGSVVVSRPATPAACTGAAALEAACHEQRYHQLVATAGVGVAFAELRRQHDTDGFVRDACHYLAHAIGHAAGERSQSVAAAFDEGDTFCSAGYYHGVMEAVVARAGPEGMLRDAGDFCAELRIALANSFLHRNCAHGLGHGFSDALGHALFVALEACDALPDAWEREACYGGVFMENVMTTDHHAGAQPYLDPQRPLYPCTAVAERYKSRCYPKQAAYVLLTVGNDFAGAFAVCGAAAEVAFRPACHQGLGGSAAASAIRQVTGDAAVAHTTRERCLAGSDPAARADCVVGAVRAYLHYYAGGEQVLGLCDVLDPGLRTVCLREAEQHREGAFPD